MTTAPGSVPGRASSYPGAHGQSRGHCASGFEQHSAPPGFCSLLYLLRMQSAHGCARLGYSLWLHSSGGSCRGSGGGGGGGRQGAEAGGQGLEGGLGL